MRSDLTMLEELGASLAPAQDQPPAEVRHRVLNGMRQPARRPRLLSGLSGVRLAWGIGAPAVAAAAVAAAMVAGQLADIAGDVAQRHGAARAAEFRDQIATGRKLAIQILEFFDRVGYLHRVRDDHLVRRTNPWRA